MLRLEAIREDGSDRVFSLLFTHLSWLNYYVHLLEKRRILPWFLEYVVSNFTRLVTRHVGLSPSRQGLQHSVSGSAKSTLLRYIRSP